MASKPYNVKANFTEVNPDKVTVDIIDNDTDTIEATLFYTDNGDLDDNVVVLESKTGNLNTRIEDFSGDGDNFSKIFVQPEGSETYIEAGIISHSNIEDPMAIYRAFQESGLSK